MINSSSFIRVLLLVSSLFMALLCSSCERNKSSRENVSLPAGVGNIAADFTLKDLQGKDIKLSDFRGKIVLSEFWATWCPPCRATIPELIAITEKYKNRDFMVLSVSFDEGKDLPKKLYDFSKEFNMNYAVLIGNDEVAKAYSVRSIPTSFLIDKNGRIIDIYMGFIDDFESVISGMVDKTI